MPTSRFNSPFSIGLAEVPQTKNKEVYGDLAAIYTAIQLLQQAITNYGGLITQPSELWDAIAATETVFPQNANRLYPEASEAINGGAVLNLWDDAGVLKVRNANATNNTKPVHAYAPLPIASGVRGEVILFQGLCTSIGGMTGGVRYFLSTSNGQITAAPPAAAGNIEQAVGVALGPELLYFKPDLSFITH